MRFGLRSSLFLVFVSLFLISVSVTQAEPVDLLHSALTNDLSSQRVECLEKLFVRQGPSIGLKAVYNSLPPEERLGLIKVLQRKLSGLVDSGVLNNPALEQLSPEQDFNGKKRCFVCSVNRSCCYRQYREEY